MSFIFITFLRILDWLFHPIFALANKLLGRTRLNWLVLDLAILPFTLLSLPTYLMGDKGARIRRKMNAYSHIHFVCRSCPKARRSLRDPLQDGNCLWNANWRAGNFDIPENFGAKNWVNQYLFKPTELSEYGKITLPIANQTGITGIRKRTWAGLISSVLVWLIIVILLVAGSRIEYLYERADVGSDDMWEDLGEVPGASDSYPPQGMTFWDGKLIFSNHWQDEKSQVYLLDSNNMSILDEFEMPAEAVHTSGLTFDGEWLWAADYKSNFIYKIAISPSFENGIAVVEEKYETGLKGTSAIAYINYDGHRLLAISDFFHTGMTYLIKLNETQLLGPESSVADLSTHSYHHGWFSQGLTWDGQYLFETVNNLGIDRVEVLDIKSWLDGGRDSPCQVTSFAFAGSASEDLANDGFSMWSSDESSYRFYKLENYKQLIPSENACSS